MAHNNVSYSIIWLKDTKKYYFKSVSSQSCSTVTDSYSTAMQCVISVASESCNVTVPTVRSLTRVKLFTSINSTHDNLILIIIQISIFKKSICRYLSSVSAYCLGWAWSGRWVANRILVSRQPRCIFKCGIFHSTVIDWIIVWLLTSISPIYPSIDWLTRVLSRRLSDCVNRWTMIDRSCDREMHSSFFCKLLVEGDSRRFRPVVCSLCREYEPKGVSTFGTF